MLRYFKYSVLITLKYRKEFGEISGTRLERAGRATAQSLCFFFLLREK